MDYTIENNTHECQDCGMKFYNAGELVNHTKKFCTFSGLDSLEGLAKYQIGKSFSKKDKKYQAASMGAMKYDPQVFSVSQLAKDAKEMQAHREQLQYNRAYSNLGPSMQYNNNGSSKVNQTKLNNYQSSIVKHGSRILGTSDISIKKLDNFGQQQPNKYNNMNQNIDNHYYSPPTQYPVYPRKPNISLLDKSNTSIANMTKSQKRVYAADKLVELDNIADMYDTSGGNNIEFRKNVDKMRKFYRKMLDQDKQFPGEFIESRVQTPINKLRDIDREGKAGTARAQMHYDSLDAALNSEKRENLEKQKKPKKKKEKKENNNLSPMSPSSNFYQYPYPYPPQYPPGYPPYQNQPQIIMMPPYNAPSQNNTSRRESSESAKYYEKMIQMKNKENKELMAMLMSLKEGRNPERFTQQALKHSNISENRRFSKSNSEQRFYFETDLNPNLSPEQKILISLQRQELDELRLLSSLPEHLQQIKMESVMRIIQTRTQLQKQILEQKARNLQEQETNQLYEEERRLRNDEWVSNERKRMIGHQMNDYLDNFKKKLQTEQVQEQQEQQQSGEQNEEYGYR